MRKLEGKIAIVTGAGQGVGRGIALAFAKEGARLALPARTPSKVEDVKKEIEALGGEAIAISCDVSKKEDVVKAVAETVKHYGTVNILVNNAQSFVPAHSLIDYEDDEISLVFNSGFMASFWFMKECFPYLKESKGKVINMGSAIATQAFPGYTAYAATKEAVRALSRIAAKEWGHLGINVNCIAPAAETNAQAESIKEMQEWSSKNGTPMKIGSPVLLRKGRPEEDIGRVAVFLTSEDASFLSGYTYWVDGGFCMDSSR